MNTLKHNKICICILYKYTQLNCYSNREVRTQSWPVNIFTCMDICFKVQHTEKLLVKNLFGTVNKTVYTSKVHQNCKHSRATYKRYSGDRFNVYTELIFWRCSLSTRTLNLYKVENLLSWIFRTDLWYFLNRVNWHQGTVKPCSTQHFTHINIF